jgi:hypothetical protein
MFVQQTRNGKTGVKNPASTVESSKALAAAKKRAGLSSDTDVIEIALERLALEDDFGARLVRNKGTVPRELDI